MFVQVIQTRMAIKLFLLTQVMMATLVSMTHALLGSSSPAAIDETIYNDLIAGKRQVVALGKAASNYILLVSADKTAATKIEDSYVYQIEQSSPLNKLSLNGGKLIRAKWPKLHKYITSDNSAFFVRDSTGTYVMVLGQSAIAFNIKKENVINMANGSAKSFMMSARVELTTYSFENVQKNLVVHRCALVTKSKVIDESAKIDCDQKAVFIVCKDKDQIVVQSAGECKDSLDWNIQNGFVDESKATLFSQDGTIYQIQAFSDKNLNKSTTFKQYKMKDFFDLSGGGEGPVDYPDDNSTEEIEKGSSGQSILSGGAKTGLIIGMVILVIFVILVVAAAAVCCFCMPKGNKKVKAKGSNAHHKKSGKGSKASPAKGVKSRRAIRSGRASGAKSRRTSKASSVATSRGASRRTPGRSSLRVSQAPSTAKSSRRALSNMRSKGGQRMSSRNVATSRRAMQQRSTGQTSSMAKSSRRPLSAARMSARMATSRQSTSRLSSKRRTSVKTSALSSRAKSSRRNSARSSAKP